MGVEVGVLRGDDRLLQRRGRAPYGVQRGFLGPTTKGGPSLSQSFTVITIETPGFARGSDGREREDRNADPRREDERQNRERGKDPCGNGAKIESCNYRIFWRGTYPAGVNCETRNAGRPSHRGCGGRRRAPAKGGARAPWERGGAVCARGGARRGGTAEDEAEAAFREAALQRPSWAERTTPSARPLPPGPARRRDRRAFRSRPGCSRISPFPGSTSGWRSRCAAGTPRRRTLPPSGGPVPPGLVESHFKPRRDACPAPAATVRRRRLAEDVVRLDPTSGAFTRGLGWALCRLGSTEAAGAFRDALHADPGCRRRSEGSVGRARRSGDLEEAAEAFRKETDSSGERRPLYNSRGPSSACSGGTRRRSNGLAEAGEAFPGTRGDRYNLGVCLFHLHRHGAAAAAFREALRIRPAVRGRVVQPRRRALRDRTARGSRGRVPRSRPGSRDTRVPTSIRVRFLALGRERQATGAFRERRRATIRNTRRPSSPSASSSLQQGKTRRRPRRSGSGAGPAGVREGAQRLGVALFRMSRTAEAAEEFREATRIFPSYMGAHFNLGLCLLRPEDREGASPAAHCALVPRPVPRATVRDAAFPPRKDGTFAPVRAPPYPPM